MIKAPQTQRGVRLVFETGFKCSGLKLARTWLTGHSGIVGNQGSTGGWGEAPQQDGKDKTATHRRLASRISRMLHRCEACVHPACWVNASEWRQITCWSDEVRQRGVMRVTRSPGQIAAAQDNVRDSPNVCQKRPPAHRDMKLDETDKPAVYKIFAGAQLHACQRQKYLKVHSTPKLADKIH